MRYDVYSEGWVLYNGDQEIHCGRVTLQKIKDDNSFPEVITEEYIIDHWGGQRITGIDWSEWSDEFTNGLITVASTDILEDAENEMFKWAQLDKPSIDINTLVDLDNDV